MKKLLVFVLMLGLGVVTLGCGGSTPAPENKGQVIGPESAPIPDPSKATGAPAKASP